VPSAKEIIPELQHLAIGDVMPASDQAYRGSWAFVLEASNDRHTRLIVRARLGYLLLRRPGLGLVRFPKSLAPAGRTKAFCHGAEIVAPHQTACGAGSSSQGG
jgi:hypothetical protein